MGFLDTVVAAVSQALVLSQPQEGRSEAPDHARADALAADQSRPGSGQHGYWSNPQTGQGFFDRDRGANFRFSRGRVVSRWEAENLYRFGGVAALALDAPVEDALREGVEWNFDQPDLAKALESFYRQLPTGRGKRGFWALCKRHLVQADQYGGALLVLGLEDGRASEEPLDEKRLYNVAYVWSFHRWQVSPHRWTLDPEDENFGAVEVWRVNPPRGGTLYVHRDRVVRTSGVELDEDLEDDNDGWGDSKYTRWYEALKRQGSTRGYVHNLVQSYQTPVFFLTGLKEKRATQGSSTVSQRVGLLNLLKGLFNALVLENGKEDFQWRTGQVNGLEKLVDLFDSDLSAVTGVPRTRLFGQSPAGLNATGEHDELNYHALVKSSVQEAKLRPLLERVTHLVLTAKEGPSSGRVPEGWSFGFKPLRLLSEKEKAELYKSYQTTNATLVAAEVLHPEEVASTYEAPGGWAPRVVLNKDLRAEVGGPDSSDLDPDFDETVEEGDTSEVEVSTQAPTPTSDQGALT